MSQSPARAGDNGFVPPLLCHIAAEGVVTTGRHAARRAGHPTSAEHFVFLEPGLHLTPCGFGGFRTIAGAIIRMETVRSARIDLEFGGFAGRLECGFHGLDLGRRDTLIRLAIQPSTGAFISGASCTGLFGQDRVLRIDQRAVKRYPPLSAHRCAPHTPRPYGRPGRSR